MYNRLSYYLQTNITVVPEQCDLGEEVSTEKQPLIKQILNENLQL
jgi:hypothetical protein